jgi:hypothetical protein
VRRQTRNGARLQRMPTRCSNEAPRVVDPAGWGADGCAQPPCTAEGDAGDRLPRQRFARIEYTERDRVPSGTERNEGKDVAIEYRWAEGIYDRLPALAVNLVDLKVDVIVASGGTAPLAAKSATPSIPIIFIIGGDPVAAGLVTSLARPGGNLTGFSLLVGELMPKRLELLSDVVPQARSIALLVNPNSASTERTIRDMQEAARAKGVQLKAGTESEIIRLVRRGASPCAPRRLRSVFRRPARAACGAGITPCRSGDL